jgi:hypothetical protein
MIAHIPPEWHVPEVFQRRLGDSAGRQRAMSAEGHLLLILHDPPQPGVPQRAGRLFWRSPDGVWRASRAVDGMHALRRHVAKFAERVEELDGDWKDAGSAADYFDLLRALAPLHRTARNLHTTLQQARELAPADRDLINLRDQAGEIERAAELLHGDAKNGLDFTMARQAEEQAQRTYDMAVAAHRLNLLAAVFFPVATLSAIFGMNLAHGMEESEVGALFWIILGVGLVSGVLLARAIARKPAPPSTASGTAQVRTGR